LRTDSTPATDQLSRSLKEFGPIGIVTLLVILLLGSGWFRGLLVLIWANFSRTPFRELGFVRPKNWPITLLSGIVLGAFFKIMMKAVVMPLLGAPSVNQPYHFLVDNTAALPAMVFTLTITAGFGEETVFRGYLFERCRKIFGCGQGAMIATVLFTSAIFASAHFVDQGWPGVEQALFTGLFFAALFLSARNLWLPMLAHAAFDLTALAMIYWNVESEIAHLFFH
jgi:membrane protease YdiL (CAAX protease family)